MKLMSSVLAGLVLAICSGCATTQGSTQGSADVAHPGNSASVIASAKSLPQCVAGWNQCVCEKDSRCCSVRTDCECSESGHAACH